MIEILLICEYIQTALICYVHLDLNVTKNIYILKVMLFVSFNVCWLT